MEYRATQYTNHSKCPDGVICTGKNGEFMFLSNDNVTIILDRTYNHTYSNGYVYFTHGGSTYRVNTALCVSETFKSDWEFNNIFSYYDNTLLVGDDQIIGANGLQVMKLKNRVGVTYSIIDVNDYVMLVCKMISDDNGWGAGLNDKAYVYVYDCDFKKILKSNCITRNINTGLTFDVVKLENCIILNGLILINGIIVDTDAPDPDNTLKKCVICNHKVYLPQITELDCRHKIHDACVIGRFVKCPQHSALGWFYK